MGRILRRNIAIAVALAAVLAGGTAVAVGATSGHARPSHPKHLRLSGSATRRRGGLIAAAVAYLGVPRSQLKEDLRSGKTLAQIAAATPGKSEAGLIAAMVAAVKAKLPSPPPDLETRVKALVNRAPSTELNRHLALAGGRHGALRAAVLSYLGLSRHQLIEQLRSGKTLAQIADATPGKSAAGLREALVKLVTTRLAAATAAHKLSRQAEAARLTALENRISHLLERRPHVGRHFAGKGTSTAPVPGG